MTPQIDEKLLEKLSAKRGPQHAEAVEVLERLGDDAIEPLVNLLQAEARKRKRRVGVYATVMLLWAPASVLTEVTGYGSSVWSFSGMKGLVAHFLAVSKKQKNAASWLSRFDDVRAVGPLLQALEFQDKGVRAVAVERLVALLPKLQASHANLLTDEDRAALRKVLRDGIYGKQTSLVLAALQAVRQVGDEKTLPFVEKLAEMTTTRADQARVRDAAVETLPFLRELVDRQRETQTLLRAATAPGDPGSYLLRPAQGAPTGEPELLVRPVSAPEEGT